jgi:excisionase family DNA binding protein
MQEKLYTITQAAEVLGLSKETLNEYVQKKRIDSYINEWRRRIITQTALDTFAAIPRRRGNFSK